MDKPTGASFELSDDPDATERHASCKGNPATNEWIPSADTVGDRNCLCALFLTPPYVRWQHLCDLSSTSDRITLKNAYVEVINQAMFCFVSGVSGVRQAQQKRQLRTDLKHPMCMTMLSTSKDETTMVKLGIHKLRTHMCVFAIRLFVIEILVRFVFLRLVHRFGSLCSTNEYWK